MKCPNCDALLAMSEKNGVSIDYCPTCRGIWLERGKLDNIIEKSSTGSSSVGRRLDKDYFDDNDDYYYDKENRHHDKDHYDNDNFRKGKKKGFLSDLFDF